MSHRANRSFRSRFAAAALVLLGAAACRDNDPAIVGMTAVTKGEPNVGMVVSTPDAAAGQQVTVAVTAEGPNGVKLHGLQGTLRFNADRLSYVGQSIDEANPVMLMVNEKSAAQGSVRFITVNPKGLDTQAAVFVFEVKNSGYTRGLAFDFEGAAALHTGFSTANVQSEVRVAQVAVASVVHGLGQAEWVARLKPSMPGDIQLTPGQYLLNLKYGDATRNGAVNVLDVAYLSDLAIGLDLLIDASPRDAVIAGNVAPLNDGVGGAVRPGLEPAGSNPYGVINVLDVSAISDASVGFPTAPVGSIVPGRGPQASNVVVVNTDITANTTWTKNNIYQVGDAGKGIVYVTNNATLTIEPGTRVEGWYGTGVFGSGGVGVGQGTLIVRRDGMINADGTALEPIVFTCKLPPFVGPRGEPVNTRWPGCWGGMIISGNATINSDAPTSIASGPAVPGRTVAGCINEQDESDAATVYGGCNDDDNSGVLRYVRSEYGGARFSLTKERNGITFNGVGRGTTIDFIQAYASLDDGTEYFGGTVNVKHVYNIANEDDNIDWVLGWRGSAQFIIVQADSVDGDRCMEMDNNGIDAAASNPDASPRSNPTIFNVTCVGKAAPVRYGSATGIPASCHTQLSSGGAPTQNCVNQAMLFRQNTAGSIRNAIAYRYSVAIDMDKHNAGTWAGDGLCTQIGAAPAAPGLGTGLSVRNMLISLGPTVALPVAGSSLSAAGDVDNNDPSLAGACAGYTLDAGADNLEALYIADPANSITVFGNDNVAGDYLINPLDVMAPDFRPKPGSAPVTATAAANPGTVNGLAFETANYIGAVPAANSAGSNIPWYSGWTRGWTTPSQK